MKHTILRGCVTIWLLWFFFTATPSFSQEQSQNLFVKAEAMNPNVAGEFSYLSRASLDSDIGRAAGGADIGSDILFIEEDEE